MGRDGLSLYNTRGNRCFGLILSVVLLGMLCLFFVNSAIAQDDTVANNAAAQAELDQARSLRQNNQYPEATQAFTNIISTYPQTDYALQAYQDLTLMQVDQGSSIAIETLQQGLMQDFANHPKIAEAVYHVGYESMNMLWWGVEQDASAERLAYFDGVVRQICSDVLQRWPNSEQAMWAQRGFVFADIHKGDYAAAEAATETLIVNYPEHKDLPQAVCWLGNDYCRMKQYDKTRSCYQYVADRWPGNEFGGQSQRELIMLGLELRDEAGTEAAITTLLANFSAPAVNQVIGAVSNQLWQGVEQNAPAERLTEYDGIARRLCGHIIQKWPDSEEAMWAQRGIVFADIHKGDYAAATAATEVLVANYPSHEDLVQAYFYLGNDYLRMKQYAHARDCYQFVANHGPDNPYGLGAQKQVVLANIELKDQAAVTESLNVMLTDFAEHKEIAESTYQVTQTCVDKLWNGVERNMTAEDINYLSAMVKNLCGRYLQRWPGSEQAMLVQRGIAFAEIHLGDYAAADAAIETLLADYPDHKELTQAMLYLGNDYYRMNQYDKARTYYQYTADHWPQTDSGIWGFANVIRCNIRLNQVEDINTAINLLTDIYRDHNLLDHVILEIGEEHLRLAILDDKQGKAVAAEKNYMKALNLFEKIIREMPDSKFLPYAHYMGGTCHVKLLQYGQGVEYYQKVVDKWPDFMHARSAQTLAGSYTISMRERGELTPEEANPRIQAAFENVLTNYKNPNSYTYRLALQRLGQLHMQEGRWQEAAMYYEIFREDIPNYKYIGSILGNLVQVYESMGEPALAIDVCEEFMQKCPDDPRIDHIIAKLDELTGSNK